MPIQKHIDINQWRSEHKKALEASQQAYKDLLMADSIEDDLHRRVAIRSEARERYEKAQDKLDILQQQWGNGWRDQNGNLTS